MNIYVTRAKRINGIELEESASIELDQPIDTKDIGQIVCGILVAMDSADDDDCST